MLNKKEECVQTLHCVQLVWRYVMYNRERKTYCISCKLFILRKFVEIFPATKCVELFCTPYNWRVKFIHTIYSCNWQRPPSLINIVGYSL